MASAANSSRIRPNRYRKSLLDRAQTRRIGQVVNVALLEARLQLEAGAASPAEFCAQYITTYLKALRPRDWRGGPHGDSGLTAMTFAHPKLATFANHSLRSIPLAVNRSLCMWQAGSYDLRLSFTIPSPRQVLRMQCEGARCVTAITDSTALQEWVLGERDPLSFLLHDLVHAEHFFSKPAMMAAQIGFCRLMTRSLQQGVLAEALAADPEFRAELDYVLADMNSHGVHMVKYLKAILTKAARRREGMPAEAKGLSARLTAAGEAWIVDHLERLAGSWGLGAEGVARLLAVNTGGETDELLLDVDRFLQEAATLPYPVSASVSLTHPPAQPAFL